MITSPEMTVITWKLMITGKIEGKRPRGREAEHVGQTKFARPFTMLFIQQLIGGT